MRKSWCNILLSKSEVLSLSLIEASAMGLPTIYPKSLDTGDYDHSTFKVEKTLHQFRKSSKKLQIFLYHIGKSSR